MPAIVRVLALAFFSTGVLVAQAPLDCRHAGAVPATSWPHPTRPQLVAVLCRHDPLPGWWDSLWIAERRLGAIDPLPDQFSKLAQEIREDVKRILLRLSPTTESNSPVRLNDLGRRIADSRREVVDVIGRQRLAAGAQPDAGEHVADTRWPSRQRNPSCQPIPT